MNKSNINVPSAGTEADSDSTAQNEHISQPNANTNVVGSHFNSREIKFRAWDGEKLIYPVNGWFEKVSLPDHLSYQSMQLGTAIRYLKVTQYTGLKDKNGKEIYEGDIVKHAGWLCVVKFGENGACFSLVTKSGETDLSVMTEAGSNYIEVIGNIFENPELLQSVV